MRTGLQWQTSSRPGVVFFNHATLSPKPLELAPVQSIHEVEGGGYPGQTGFNGDFSNRKFAGRLFRH